MEKTPKLDTLEWRDYPGERVAKMHPSGFLVVKPKECTIIVPLYCPVCEQQMRDPSDPEIYRKWMCCIRCATHYAEPNKDKWRDGWRPHLKKQNETNT